MTADKYIYIYTLTVCVCHPKRKAHMVENLSQRSDNIIVIPPLSFARIYTRYSGMQRLMSL